MMVTNGEVIANAEAEADFMSDIVRSVYVNAYLKGHDDGWMAATYTGDGTRVQRAYDLGFKDGIKASVDGVEWVEVEPLLEHRKELGLDK